MSVNKHVSTEVASVQENINEPAIIRQVSLVSIIGNFVLTAFKLFAGIVGHSSAMVSDSIHSLSDVISTLIAFWGVRMSKKAADKSHPYGHERIECVASLILGLLLMATGVGIGKVGLQTILSGEYDTLAVPGAIALTAAVVSIALKEAMFWYTRHYAKKIDSSALMADAWHHRSDALSSVGALIGIGGAMLGFPIMDSIASLVIFIFIVKAAYDIFKDADWFHFTGITPAVSDSAAVLTEEALKAAKKHGVKVSVDLNFRKKLWTKEKAQSIMRPLMQYVDVCIGNEEDAELCH